MSESDIKDTANLLINLFFQFIRWLISSSCHDVYIIAVWLIKHIISNNYFVKTNANDHSQSGISQKLANSVIKNRDVSVTAKNGANKIVR